MLLGVDVGGTFTDAVLVAGGVVHTAKAPTTPDDQSRGVMAAVERALDGGRRAGGRRRGLRPRHDGGHQRAARGHRRAHRVRRHRRLHRRRRPRPPGAARALPAVRRAPGAADPARAALRGARAHRAPTACSSRWRDLEALVDAVAGAEPEAVAVCLLHSYRHPDHERAIGDALRERLGVHVSLSHEVVGTFREFERAATTEVDAALSPLLARYLRRLLDAARDAGLPDPGDHAVQRRPGRRSTPPPTTPRSPCSAARPAARRPRPCSPSAAASPTCCASTWAARRATCASSRAAACARRRRARSAAGRWRCRWSTSTPSAPAAARSAGATRAARCASARAARAPSPGPRATGAAAPSRRSPTPTSSSAT